MLVLFIAIVLTLPPLLLARWAWRARRSVRIGAHPHCRRCDQNLFGLPATSDRCPECGGNLRDVGAIVTGAPRANRVVAVIAMVLTTISIALAARAWREVEWMPVRMRLTPMSWLIRETARGGPVGSRAAEELERRVHAAWYDDESLERVMRALWPVKFQVRPTVRVGADLPIAIEYGPPVTAGPFPVHFDPRQPPASSRYCVFARFDRYQIGDGPWMSGGQWPTAQGVRSAGWRREAAAIPAATVKGPTTVRLVFAMRLVAHGADTDGIGFDAKGAPYRRWVTPDEPATLAWEERIDVPLTILPAQAIGVELVTDPGLRPAVQASLRPSLLSLRDGTRVRGVQIEKNYAGEWDATWGIEVRPQPPPIGLAFDVFLRDTARATEMKLGSITHSASGWSSRETESPPANANLLEQVAGPTGDIILRPSPDKARGTTDLLKIWGEEVVLKGVPVVREPPVPSVTTPP